MVVPALNAVSNRESAQMPRAPYSTAVSANAASAPRRPNRIAPSIGSTNSTAQWGELASKEYTATNSDAMTTSAATVAIARRADWRGVSDRRPTSAAAPDTRPRATTRPMAAVL